MRRGREEGVVLINVLVMLALTATIVYAMLSLAEISVSRSQRFSEAGQALALLRAGEQSAIVALRRDMIEAPEVDHGGEAWARVGQEPVEIAGGAFALVIEDAQGRFDLNGLARGGLAGLQSLQAIVAAAGLPPEAGQRIAAALASEGPVEAPEALAGRAGLAPEDLAALAPFVTALPGPGEVNVNAAPLELLAALLANPVQARLIGSIRERRGAVTRADLAAAQIILPPGVGFRSDHFRLTVAARIGETVQTRESLLQRRQGPGGAPEVVVVERRAAAASSDAAATPQNR